MIDSSSKILLISDNIDSSITQAFSDRLLTLEATTKKVTYKEVDDRIFKNHSHYIAILPENFASQTSLPLAEMVGRLKSIATAPKDSCIAYIQFGSPNSDNHEASINLPSLCAAAFARSVHLERPDLKVRVVTLAPEIEPQQAAEIAISDLEGEEAIATVSYDADLVRFVPQSRLQQPFNYTERSLLWSDEDVILVTGGGKGITAECALALAESQKVRMALVGRSANSNAEVTSTLERFRAKGLICNYYSCDITNIDAVRGLVAQITNELGTVTGVIHGAGLNKSRRVKQISASEAVAEASPKLLGADNLLRVLAATPPKLFIAFSSIIGVTGMPGNAWYAFANESLQLMLRRFEQEHPSTQVLSLAYSVWGEVGMGARMGSVKNLARMGINAIPTCEGVNRFLKLFTHDPGVKQVVIAARLNGLDTWTPAPLSIATGLRFIEQIVYLEPQVELTVRTNLTLERDLYVKDHVWRGSYLFPTVFGLEAMAQATAYVIGEQQPAIVRFEDISLRRPIVVNPNSGVEIQIHAEVVEVDRYGEQKVKVGISTEKTGFKTDCFTATIVVGKPTLGKQIKPKLGKALDLQPKTDLYGSLLFQGSRFQRMGAIFSLDSQNSVFRSQVLSEAEVLSESFASGMGKHILLGDPYFRDVMLQSVQLTIPQHICLPVQIEKIELFANPNSAETARIVNVELQQLEGREYISEVVTTNERGDILERLSGYRLRILEEHFENPTALELVKPQERDNAILDRVLKQAFSKFGLTAPTIALSYHPKLKSKSKRQRRTVERPLVARILKQRLGLAANQKLNFKLQTLASGKPKLAGAETIGLDVSLSHCDRYCLCVVADSPQGCDLESVGDRDRDDWIALLGSERSSLLKELVGRGDSLNRAGTRIWSALEAVRKAFNGIQPKFNILAQEGDLVLLECQTADCAVVTVPVALTRPPERMVAIVIPQVESKSHLSAIAASRHSTRYVQNGPQGQLVYEQRFQVSFKDSGSISRNVYFAQYFRWIGKLRELPMESIAQQMLSDFLSGDWGMVTNAVSLRILGEATAYDTIQGRVWVGNIVKSSFDTYIEFCKVLPDNSLERIAIAEVKATWVRLVSYGVPKPMPFPAYLQQYLAKFAPQKPGTLDLRKPETLPLPPLPASLFDLDSGAKLDCAPPQNRYGRLLRDEVFQTTLEESNVVGNVYYANYFIWQGRILDLFLYSLAAEYLRVSNPRGEIVCLYTRMDYLREAMPFDRIRTLLYIASVSERVRYLDLSFSANIPTADKKNSMLENRKYFG